ncbi:hypothetical protein EAI_16729 [Harpegnathos saltator]|uniref:Uncharacterized protein n=1 Tax=Harpegnathos saltator TaxID=610380 RepID=E2C876_HARSA|nr:hypothetical protein EAI_16729 [Harpegnathos saltator]
MDPSLRQEQETGLSRISRNVSSKHEIVAQKNQQLKNSDLPTSRLGFCCKLFGGGVLVEFLDKYDKESGIYGSKRLQGSARVSQRLYVIRIYK